NATNSEVRAPYITRESVSRPTWSVPKSASASGGLFMRAKFAFRGSRGAIQGAARATNTISSPITPPTTDSGLRRANPASSRRLERPSSGRAAMSARAAHGAGASIPDSGVEPGIREVHEHVDEDEDRRVEQHEVLDDDDVALDDRRDKRPAKTRDAERLLHRHRAAAAE